MTKTTAARCSKCRKSVRFLGDPTLTQLHAGVTEIPLCWDHAEDHLTAQFGSDWNTPAWPSA